jgi:hypothetical protein
MEIAFALAGLLLFALATVGVRAIRRPNYPYTQETCPAKGTIATEAYSRSDTLYWFYPGETSYTRCSGCGFFGFQAMSTAERDVGYMPHP